MHQINNEKRIESSRNILLNFYDVFFIIILSCVHYRLVFYQRAKVFNYFLFPPNITYYVLRLVAVILLYKLRGTEFKGSSQFENVPFMILERSRS